MKTTLNRFKPLRGRPVPFSLGGHGGGAEFGRGLLGNTGTRKRGHDNGTTVFIDEHSNSGPAAHNVNPPDCAAVDQARRRFFARHGAGADIRRQMVLSKAERKELLAAEMALWEAL
jgi:hypothetical protein